MPMKLTFLVPGFSKCGTTTLCALLATHPDIFIPERKETNFFVSPRFDELWPWYEWLFSPAGNASALGEGSTFYSAQEHEKLVRDRVLQHFPNIRLIFIARNPFERLESSYREFHHSGPKFGINTPHELGKALAALPNMIEDTLFWRRINNYRERIPDERIHVLFLEDLKKQPDTELSRCFDFLGVDPQFRVPDTSRQLNRGSKKLYDSKLFRWMRTNRLIGPPISKISISTQDRIGSKMGLRKTFHNKIEWDIQTQNQILSLIGDDMASFLQFYGKSGDFWKKPI